ncbi:MAG: NrpR regulatory domain-containing protein [Syntrophales bacterium]|nr:NrpR regulatory domain-containing protein [Syntrophales bacterium]
MIKLFAHSEDTERKSLLILRILSEAGQPLGSRHLARRMQEHGVVVSERAVRYHLRLLDERGLTALVGKRDGRVITPVGIDEVGKARVRDKVGMAISRIEILAFKTTFDPATGTGVLPVNISLLPRADFPAALAAMKPVFEAGYVVSKRLAIAAAGERLGGLVIPEGKVGVATVCSIVINGVLLKSGIPMDSKFGGILQIRDRRPLRFVELISYAGSSLDPSEVFIRGKMTDVRGAAQTGEGMILANFREVPAPCYPLMTRIIAALAAAGIGGTLVTGEISEPVCEVPVDMNKGGVILIGGLNPVAAAQEAGIDVENRAMSAVMDFGAFRPFLEIYQQHQ